MLFNEFGDKNNPVVLIMEGYGHGEFLMKHQTEVCDKICKALM